MVHCYGRQKTVTAEHKTSDRPASHPELDLLQLLVSIKASRNVLNVVNGLGLGFLGMYRAEDIGMKVLFI